jgi:hypothetical protein
MYGFTKDPRAQLWLGAKDMPVFKYTMIDKKITLCQPHWSKRIQRIMNERFSQDSMLPGYQTMLITLLERESSLEEALWDLIAFSFCILF